MWCTECRQESTNINELLLNKINSCNRCKQTAATIQRLSLISKMNYEEIIKNGILKETPIYDNGCLITANTIKFKFDDFNGESYIYEICEILNLAEGEIYDKKEKYSIFNMMIGKIYDDLYRACSGTENGTIILLLTALEYNRYITLGLVTWLKGANLTEAINDSLVRCIIQTLDMYKSFPNVMQQNFINYESLYCDIERLMAIDKLALEYGIEAIELKREKLFNCDITNKDSNFKKIIQILRALCIINNLKIEYTEGRLKDRALSIDKDGKLIWNYMSIDYSSEYVSEMKATQNEVITDKHIKSINRILNNYKGFNIETIKKIINTVQSNCEIGDEFLIADKTSWLIVIQNSCSCSREIACKIFEEFVYKVDKEKVFSERTRIEYRAMRKCFYEYDNRYIAVVNLLSFCLQNWIVCMYAREIEDENLKKKMQVIHDSINTEFEKSVYCQIKDELKVETIKWNVENKEINYGKKVIELPGQIDVLLYLNKKIFVIECKNLELKSDPKSSANEYNKLTKTGNKTFQDKLHKKINIINQNKIEVLDFLEVTGVENEFVEVIGVIVVKTFTDASLVDTENYEVVTASNICEWIRNKSHSI